MHKAEYSCIFIRIRSVNFWSRTQMRGRRGLEGWGELMLASFRGHEEDVAALLDSQADPNETDNLGRTALIHAAAQGHHTVVSLLLAR